MSSSSTAKRCLRSVRRKKSPADIDAIRAAVAVADDAVDAVTGALRPGLREIDLAGVFLERMATHGVTTPAFDPVVSVVEEGVVADWSTDRVIADGDLVAISAGVLANGWEAAVARTVPCGELSPEHQPAWHAWHDRWPELFDRCRPGARIGDLRGEGVELHGVGASYEVLFEGDVLEPDMVVALELRHAAVLGGDILRITDGDPESLTGAAGAPPAGGAA